MGLITGVQFPAVAVERIFSLCHHIQTSSGTHPVSHPINTWGSFPRVKWLGHEADHSPPSGVDIKNAWSYNPTHLYVFMVWWLYLYLWYLSKVYYQLTKFRVESVFNVHMMFQPQTVNCTAQLVVKGDTVGGRSVVENPGLPESCDNSKFLSTASLSDDFDTLSFGIKFVSSLLFSFLNFFYPQCFQLPCLYNHECIELD
jgi:hypothetical protein